MNLQKKAKKIPPKSTGFLSGGIVHYPTTQSSGVHTVSQGFLKVKGWSYSPLGH